MQINAISILLKYIVTLKLAIGCDLLTGSFSCRMAKYIVKKKWHFPWVLIFEATIIFLSQKCLEHSCWTCSWNSICATQFGLIWGQEWDACPLEAGWRHWELGRKRGISQKVGCQISGYTTEIPQQLWINALFQLSGVSVQVGIWREAVPAPWMLGKAMAALQDLVAHAGIYCWQAAAFAASWVQLLGIVNLLPFVVRVLPFPPT